MSKILPCVRCGAVTKTVHFPAALLQFFAISACQIPAKKERCSMKNCSALFFAFQCKPELGKAEKIAEFSTKGHQSTDPGAIPAPNVENYFICSSQAFIFLDARVSSLTCSRFIQYFFSLKAMARRNNSMRMLARPRVRNLRKPKSFFSRAKAPSA